MTPDPLTLDYASLLDINGSYCEKEVGKMSDFSELVGENSLSVAFVGVYFVDRL